MENINDKKAYLLKLSDQLRQKEIEIDKLKEKVNAAEDDIRTDLLKEINGLSMKQETVWNNIKQLQEARDDMWDDIKGGVEKSWIELRDTFPMVYSKLRCDWSKS